MTKWGTDKPTRGKAKIRTLLARDGEFCWLCGERFSNKSGRKPSLDHVIPKSKGGSNSNDNLKLAHSRCNYERGNADHPSVILRPHTDGPPS